MIERWFNSKMLPGNLPNTIVAQTQTSFFINNNNYITMADKFPALEDIGDFSGSGDGGDSDFLSRERALLGDDADQFVTSADNAVPEDEDDEFNKFESSFPSVDSQQPQVSITNQSQFQDTTNSSNEFINSNSTQPKIESEAVKEWKERRNLEIQKRDEISLNKKKDIQEKAKKAIDDFYDNYNSKKDKFIDKTRNDESKFIENRDGLYQGGTTWDRALKLIDTNDKSLKIGVRDKTRFKEILVSLKGNAEAPGAAGY